MKKVGATMVKGPPSSRTKSSTEALLSWCGTPVSRFAAPDRPVVGEVPPQISAPAERSARAAFPSARRGRSLPEGCRCCHEWVRVRSADPGRRRAESVL